MANDLDLADTILNDIKARLEWDTRINIHQSPITVKVENNKIFLEGCVENISEKRAAVDIAARAISGMAHWPIIDRLHVKPVQHREDLELKAAVTLALNNEPVFNDYSLYTKVADEVELIRDKQPGPGEITATIQNGSITLSGYVESNSHRRLAEVLMWWTDGCEFVDNLLQVVPSYQDNDNEITDAVRIILEKDPLVHASQLLIGTAAGVVILNGSVASEEEKKLAIMDTWYVPGVVDVVDRIEARH